jgi:hypothetical protein
MISDGRTNANRKVQVKGVGENLLPTAQEWGLWWPGPPVAAPGTRHRHTDLLCYLCPGQALVPELHDLLRRGGVSLRTAPTQSDASRLELLADRAPMNALFGTDLSQGPALGVQVGCAVNVHGVTVTAQSPKTWSAVLVIGCVGSARGIRWPLGCDVLVDVEEVARIVRPLDLD